MKIRNMVILLVIAGVLAVLAALWSGAAGGPGPVRMGEGGMAAQTRTLVMVLTLIGGIGALVAALTIKALNRKLLGIATLVFAALMVPSIFQGNVLSILSLVVLALAGITLLVRPYQEPQSTTPPPR